ncbi:MAG: hypothetical protein HKO59_10985 [Phycisphaerales bacterium]|nr:hypothetical protein [Phycisphaerae bacterium]NNF44093.1 hypothetical protein [Phycisphaerales bacterium]NNM26488.1 hypothetical protein [Phycisphaerales bacterium]
MMRIELRDERRQRIGRIMVDPSLRPTRVSVIDAQDRDEVFLNWDIAMDDAGHLRRCVTCECRDLFVEKAFPQITAFVVVLAFLLAVLGAAGFATTWPMFVVMGVVFFLDVGILLFSRRRLVCYRCRSSYHGLPIARYHRGWDRTTADRYSVSGRAEPADTAAAEASPAGTEQGSFAGG